MTKSLKTYLAGAMVLGSIAFTGYQIPKSMLNPEYNNLYNQEIEMNEKIGGLEKDLIQYHEAFIEANSIKDKEGITNNAAKYTKIKKELPLEKAKLSEITNQEKPYKKRTGYVLLGLLGIVSTLSAYCHYDEESF